MPASRSLGVGWRVCIRGAAGKTSLWLFHLLQEEAGEMQLIVLGEHHRHTERDLSWRIN